MKILQLSYEIYPVIGGTSTLIPYLMDGLEDTNCVIYLITKTIDKNHPSVIERGKSKIYTIYCNDAEETNPEIETKTQVRFLRVINSIISSGVKFDLIHVHDALPIDLIPYLKKKLNIPILMSYHINHHILRKQAQLTNDTDVYKNAIALELEKKGACLCDYFMAASNSTKKWLATYYGIGLNKISVVPYGLNFDFYKEEIDCSYVRQNLGRDDQKIILYVGRFVLQKGIDFLLEAFEDLTKEMSNVKLVLVGEGKKKNEIEKRLSKLGKDKYIILDKIPFEKLPPYYKAADIVVMPSIFEPFGMVSIEGMASKAMMLISKIDGLGEIVIDQFNGLVINVYENKDGSRYIDTNELKNIMIKALNEDTKNMKIRDNARKYVLENYSAEKFAYGVYDVYKKILGGDICE